MLPTTLTVMACDPKRLVGQEVLLAEPRLQGSVHVALSADGALLLSATHNRSAEVGSSGMCTNATKE